MIFNKEFVVDKFHDKINELVTNIFPFETNDKPGEISSGKNMILSYYQYFDLKSEEAKDCMFKARKEINDVCFKDENLGVYPNTLKIENCIHAVEIQHLGKLYDNRNLYFGNSKKNLVFFYFYFKEFI